MPSFLAIGQTVAKIWRFFDFSKMAAVRHLGFVMREISDHPRRTFGGSGFDNMQVLISCELGLKTPIHGPKIGVLGQNRGMGVRC